MVGGERALSALIACFPGADVFPTVDFLPAEHRHILRGARVSPSAVQRMPWARTRHQYYLPVMPLCMEQLDLAGYDLIVSNSHAVAKGVTVHPEQVHVSYVLSPMRFAWDLQASYLRDMHLDGGIRGLAARLLLHRLRVWDVTTAARVDAMAVPSRYIARRVELCYRRTAVIIPPPVDVDFFTPGAADVEDFYLTASRLIPFKRTAAIVQAFSTLPARRLVVIGDGPDLARLRAMATPNVTFTGYQSADVLRDHMRRARAFLFAAPEDFGIVMVEAQACGTPVIAVACGGALDIVRSIDHAHPTGLLVHDSAPLSIAEGVRLFERDGGRITAANCRANSLRVRPERFAAECGAFADEALARYGTWSAR